MTGTDVTANTEPKPQAQAQEPKSQRERKRRFIGFSEQMEMKRNARRDKPRTWIERKLVVPFAFGIVGYTWYVYIGRFCVPMLRRDEDAMGGRAIGVVFTVVFCLLGLMTWWTYIKLILTPPGFAKDYVPTTSTPIPQDRRVHGRTAPSAQRSRSLDSDGEDWGSDEEFRAGTPYAEISPHPSRSPTNEGPSQSATGDLEKRAGLSIPSAPHWPPASVTRTLPPPKRKHSDSRSPVKVTEKQGRHSMPNDSGGERDTDETAVDNPNVMATSKALSHPAAQHAAPRKPSDPHSARASQSNRNPEEGLPPLKDSRHPPTYPSLLPEYRYCDRDRLVKPMRAHHCRVCGTCVLMYDHHCPWIGHCVGAHNHKFFVNFLIWSTPWTLWILITLAALQGKRASDTDGDVDPQIIVIIALSAFFTLFTSVLLAGHVHMIILNQTSVESIYASHMRERERAILSRTVPLCDWRRRNAVRKEWDREWGKINTEGNIWWLESVRANWEYRMGRNPWGWFLPIGESEGDGVTYPTNPRFDADGRWRRRSEWPPEFR